MINVQQAKNVVFVLNNHVAYNVSYPRTMYQNQANVQIDATSHVQFAMAIKMMNVNMMMIARMRPNVAITDVD